MTDDAAEREQTRRAAFLALVATQDEGHTVKSSREHVARRVGLRVVHVRAIEREGITNNWPPLGGDAGLTRHRPTCPRAGRGERGHVIPARRLLILPST